MMVKKLFLPLLSTCLIGSVSSADLEMPGSSHQGIVIDQEREVFRDKSFHLIALPHYVQATEDARSALKILSYGERFTLACGYLTPDGVFDYYQHFGGSAFLSSLLTHPIGEFFQMPILSYDPQNNAYDYIAGKGSMPNPFRKKESSINKFVGEFSLDGYDIKSNACEWNTCIKGFTYSLDLTSLGKEYVASLNTYLDTDGESRTAYLALKSEVADGIFKVTLTALL